jgi:putative spermidine/putrescine transport system permease protein
MVRPPTACRSRQPRRADRRRKITAFLLVAPLLAFIVITFIIPIADMLWRSVDNPAIATTCPRPWRRSRTGTARACRREAGLRRDGRGSARRPGEPAIGPVGIRLNYEMSGARSLITRTSARGADEPRAALQGGADPRRAPQLERPPRSGASSSARAGR